MRVDRALQQDFALNQPLAPFLVDVVPLLDADDANHGYAVLAAVESVLDDPRQVLFAQRDRAKTEAMAAMKAAGIEYEERIEQLDKISWPKPMAEELYDVFDEWRITQPWIDGANISPKGVVRDMWDRAMDFHSFVRHYGLKRSEGALLRYLSDAYRTITRTIPEETKTDEIREIADWLDGVIRTTDSSLIDEWQALRDGGVPALAAASSPEPVDLLKRPASLRALIRSRVFRWVQLASQRNWDQLHDDLAEAGEHHWKADVLASEFATYFAEHEVIVLDGDARGPQHFVVAEDGRQWTVRQTIVDPEGFNEWQLSAIFDLDATEIAGELQATFAGLRQAHQMHDRASVPRSEDLASPDGV